jgi:hypothetical protein
MNYLLSVGINKYKQPGNDLRGCVNDVLNIRKTLAENCGFSYVSMRTLFDSAATKNNIIEGLKNMVRLAARGDHLIYHHSSHGSQVEDTSGDESDSLDEILCPYDFSWDGIWISDDELKEVICNMKKGITLDIVLDSCHSGTGIRKLEIRPKCITPIHLPKANLNRLLSKNLPSTVTLWAGCKSDQTSADALIGGQYNGAMTYFLCDEIRKANGKVTRSRLYSNLKKSIKEYEQTPQLECTLSRRYRRIFT